MERLHLLELSGELLARQLLLLLLARWTFLRLLLTAQTGTVLLHKVTHHNVCP
jgi:hypothetical protein